MNGLPNELSNTICSYLEGDQQTLKALRLACKPFNLLAAPYIFKTVQLEMHPESWGKLNLIACHPVLRNYVERLICATDLLPRLVNYEAWEEKVKIAQSQHAAQGLSDLVTGEHYLAVTTSLRGYQLRNEELLHHYEKYDFWNNGECYMMRYLRVDHQDPPMLLLSQLFNLHSIETRSISAQQLLMGSFYEQGLSRKEQDCVVPAYTWTHDNAHIALLLQSVELNGVHLTSLTLDHRSECFLRESTHYFWRLQGAIKHLRYLNLQLVNEDFELYSQEHLRTQCVQRLASATELETFKLTETVSDYNCGIPLIQALEGLVWPKLHTLHLKLEEAGLRDIKAFLLKHRSSLRELHISGATFFDQEPWSWMADFAELSRRLSLEHLTFCDIGMYNLLEVDKSPFMNMAMNEELQYIIIHGHSSSDAERRRRLGEFFPEFVRNDIEGDYIMIPYLERMRQEGAASGWPGY